MGRLWLVLGAPEGLLRVVLASVKPISTIKTGLPSFDTLFSLAVAVAVAVAAAAAAAAAPAAVAVVLVAEVVVVVAVVVVVSLLPCNFSSTRLGGMRGAI